MAVLTALVLVAVAGSPAQAQTKVRKDKVGERGIGATWDLRSVKVQNTSRRFALTVRVGDVRRGRTAVTSAIVPAKDVTSDPTKVRNYSLSTLPGPRGRWVTDLALFDETAEQSDPTITCRGLKTTADEGRRGFVRVVVPQRCFGADRGRMLTFASTYDTVVTTEADGMRHAARQVAAARRGDGVVPDDQLFDSLTSDGITTRRGR
ncbi:hypothetical protein [Solicola sp. PLA-1-18]|uniref:hypothetical protein n=1 Tax=Solicola sp. PLA-1-18 TaxID=3380532 RepID=UPI003B7A26CC